MTHPRTHKAATRGIALARSAARLTVSLISLSVSHVFAQSDVSDLGRMTLQELANVEVTSVAKVAQKLSTAPAAIYVITREEILRSGAIDVPEALRLAPNLQVERLGASTYSITARGFGNNPTSQYQANKLLVLIDGRAVYSPLYSGVSYDAQDVVLNDIEQIEVISGPGASLWGANAMNGVINIITRSAASSQGTLARVGAGAQDGALAARYGGRFGSTSYRVFAKAVERGSLEFEDKSSALDRWSRVQTGFRADWVGEPGTMTVQGDAYRLNQSTLERKMLESKGANVLARWEIAGPISQWTVQAYYDLQDREGPPDGASFELDTLDFEIQQALTLGSHQVVWGLGKRRSDYRFTTFRPLEFSPAERSLDLTSAFVQDTLSWGAWEITAGVKLEDNPFDNWEALPDLRVSYLLGDTAMLWASASRAIRAPTPFDVDIIEHLAGTQFIVGNPDFREERLTAYQLGYRHQPASNLSVSITGFYHDYEHLRSIEPDPTTFLPLTWQNEIGGNTYGVEAWASFQIAPWWRIAPSFRLLHKRLRASERASGLLGVGQTGNDPRTEASIKSSMDLTPRVTFDAYLRYVDELPEAPSLDEHYNLSARIAWNVTGSLQLSLSGFNLLSDRLLEYRTARSTYIPRSVFAEVRWSH